MKNVYSAVTTIKCSQSAAILSSDKLLRYREPGLKDFDKFIIFDTDNCIYMKENILKQKILLICFFPS